jgi:hypothetical protein
LWEIKPQERMMVQTLDASRSNQMVISLRDQVLLHEICEFMQYRAYFWELVWVS